MQQKTAETHKQQLKRPNLQNQPNQKTQPTATPHAEAKL
jgi:hypothetical protein